MSVYKPFSLNTFQWLLLVLNCYVLFDAVIAQCLDPDAQYALIAAEANTFTAALVTDQYTGGRIFGPYYKRYQDAVNNVADELRDGPFGLNAVDVPINDQEEYVSDNCYNHTAPLRDGINFYYGANVSNPDADAVVAFFGSKIPYLRDQYSEDVTELQLIGIIFGSIFLTICACGMFAGCTLLCADRAKRCCRSTRNLCTTLWEHFAGNSVVEGGSRDIELRGPLLSNADRREYGTNEGQKQVPS